MASNLQTLSADVAESWRSIKGNKLRFFLTAAIISIGITALVGILSSLEGIQQSVTANFNKLGSSGIDIIPVGKNTKRRTRFGGDEKFKPLTYQHASFLRRSLTHLGQVAVYTYASYNAEIKGNGNKSNPNSIIVGITPEYLPAFGISLSEGRNFTQGEISKATFACLIGQELREKLFPNQSPIQKMITVQGYRVIVIGVLAKSGGVFSGPSTDRAVIVPLDLGRRLNKLSYIGFDVRLILNPGLSLESTQGEILSIAKRARKDSPQKAASVVLERADSAAETLKEIGGALRIGGLVISIITLLGAGIGLMNIMIVSVNERTQEIGIRKSLGATKIKIRNQFLTEAILVCLVGGASGIVFGIIIGNVVSNLVGAGGFVAPWFWLGVAIVASFCVGVLSGWLPAQRAAALDPIDALRYE